MKNKIKWIFVGIIIVGCFLFGRQCGISSVKIPTYKNDTISIHDTIFPDTTKIEVLKSYPIHDTVYVTEEVIISTDSIEFKNIFKMRKYERSFKDKNIETKVSSNILGYLIDQKVEYKDFKPISITNNTLVSVTPQDTVKTPKKWELRGTIEATNKNAFVGLEYQKDRVTYGGAYDPFNKQVKVKLGFTIFRK